MLWIAVTLPLLSLEAVKPLVPISSASPGESRNRREHAGAAPQTHGIEPDTVERCYALADHVCILLPDFDAHRAGVHTGHTRSHALALAPGLTLLAPDAAREIHAFESIALALLTYTPKVSLGQSHTLLLGVGSGLRLFGGLRGLLSRITATVDAFCYTARIACAPTAWGAWLLAQARTNQQGRRWHLVKETSLARILDALPVSLLPVASAHSDAFAQIGCATLADLRRLPRAGVVRRFGDGILTLLAQARGEQPDPRESFRAPASFRAQLELQARVDSAEALLFAARRLIAQLAGWLSAHHAAVSGYTLLLEHELAARHAPRMSSLKVAWATPSRDADHLIWLLREKLNQTELAAPVIELKLVADQISEHETQSDTLFPMPQAERDSLARLLERLSARLGPENVLQMSEQDDHRPEKTMHVETCQTEGRPRKKTSSAKGRKAGNRARKTSTAAGQQSSSASDAPQSPTDETAAAATTATTTATVNPLPSPHGQTPLDLPESALPSQPRPVWLLDKPLKLMMRANRTDRSRLVGR